MIGPLGLLLWLAEHWWIIVIGGIVVLACVAASGIVSVAHIVGDAFKVARGTADFFVTPDTQRAGKILLAVVAFCIGAWLANLYTHRADARAEAQRVAAARAAIARADASAANKAATIDQQQQTASDAADRANTEQRNAYVAALEKKAAVCSPAPDDAVRRLRNVH